ncbi:MAG TPA: phospholipid carrier-dependent glycosyltransferase [Trebonia sp.]|nr:phospholipid carrier-dependent glycosyltransferase [Trebonia sp.]
MNASGTAGTAISQRAAARPRRVLSRLTALAREHRLFSIALGAGAFLRLLAVLGYPGALWFAGDSYVYLGAALRPQPDLSKSTGYSLFLRALLPFHSLTLVTVVQHLMGLAVAVMIYALLRRNGVAKLWATVASLPVLLDGYMIEDEHLIMTEPLFTFLLMAAMLMLLWRREVRWWAALIAGLLVGYAVDVRTEGAVVLALFPLYLLIRGWRSLRGWAAAVLCAVGCLLPVGAYATWFHARTGHYGTSMAMGYYLWGRVSSFADCAVIKPAGAEAAVCPREPLSQRTPPGNFIWHAPEVHTSTYMARTGGPVSPVNNKLLTDFAIHAVEAQPLDYVKTVVKNTMLSFGFPRIAYPGAGTVYYYNFHLHYKTAKYNLLPPDNPNHEWIRGGTAYHDWLSYGRQAPGRVIEVFAVPILIYQRLVFTYGPLLALIFLIGLGGVIRLRRRGWEPRSFRLAWERRGTSMLPWVTAVALLITPIAVADFDYRYLLPVLPFACAAAGLAFAPPVKRPAPDQSPVPAHEIDSGATSGVPTSS